jgi:tetratricopeptide (TPR) repeat protein
MPGSGREKRRHRTALIAAVLTALVAVTAGGVGLWSARSRANIDPTARAASAYGEGNWTAAAKLARQTLTVRKDDPAALRLLARASARLGRDDIAMAIYQRRLDDKSLEVEDRLLRGMMLQRHGQPDAAARDWKQVLETSEVSPQTLEELGRFFMMADKHDNAMQVAGRLVKVPGWEARGSMMLGTIRVDVNNAAGAALSFRRALEIDPNELARAHQPNKLRKAIARTFLRIVSPGEAQRLLQPILDSEPDQEASFLLSRVYLQQGDKTGALAALKEAGSYRAANPLEVEPGPYTGEARCEKCHASIFRDSLASRHTQTYYRGNQIDAIPLPDQPLPDPDDPRVTHAFQKREGVLHEETRVGNEVFDAVIEYAFGTHDRYLTAISRDSGNGYHIGRLSYYQTSQGKGWDRSALDHTHPTPKRPAEFQGEPIGVLDGLAKCFYCHVTNPRTGNDMTGPEMADRAIGCERCHGPGGNHVAALQLGLPDSAIVNPAGASPEAVTTKQCNDCHILQKKFDEDPENPGWIRSQGVGWARSRCNTESGGTFGCVTCHNPHQTSKATSAAEYEGKCLKCHPATSESAASDKTAATAQAGAGPPFRTCPVNPSSGCLACHMPRVRIDSLHGDLTDHYIRVRGTKR